MIDHLCVLRVQLGTNPLEISNQIPLISQHEERTTHRKTGRIGGDCLDHRQAVKGIQLQNKGSILNCQNIAVRRKGRFFSEGTRNEFSSLGEHFPQHRRCSLVQCQCHQGYIGIQHTCLKRDCRYRFVMQGYAIHTEFTGNFMTFGRKICWETLVLCAVRIVNDHRKALDIVHNKGLQHLALSATKNRRIGSTKRTALIGKAILIKNKIGFLCLSLDLNRNARFTAFWAAELSLSLGSKVFDNLIVYGIRALGRSDKVRFL